MLSWYLNLVEELARRRLTLVGEEHCGIVVLVVSCTLVNPLVHPVAGLALLVKAVVGVRELHEALLV